VMFGGNNGGGDLNDTWVYDPDAYCWNATYLSRYYDCGRESRLVSMCWTADTPPDTSVRFQLRNADTSSGLASETFIGPDGTPYSFYTGASLVTNLPSGKRWLQYKVELETQNRSCAPAIYDVWVTFNRAPFAPDGLQPMNGQWTNESRPTFTWLFRDNDSSSQGGFVWQAFETKNFSFPSMTSGVVNSTEQSYKASDAFHDGSWYWRVATRDMEGDFGPFSDCWEMRVDTTAPAAFSPKAAPAGWTDQRQTIFFSTHDDLSGLERFEVWIDGFRYNDEENPYLLPELSDGTHEIVVRAYDQAGNCNDGIVRVFSDRTAPAPFVLAANPGSWTSSAPQVTFSPRDETSGIDHCELAVDDGSFSVRASPYTLPELAEGMHEITVRAFDLAGNFQDGKTTVYIDRTAPVPMELRVDPPGWTREDPAVLFSTADNLTDIDRYKVGIDDGNFTIRTSPFTMAGLTDGIHVITVRAFDMAGNYAEGQVQAYVDRTPPLPFVPVATPDGWANATPAVSFSTSDALDEAVTFEARVDSGPFVKVTSPWSAAGVGDGEHGITVRAFDQAGNYQDGNVRIHIDRGKPAQVSLSINDRSKTTSERDVTLTISAFDNVSGLDRMCFSNDGVNYTAWEPFTASKNWTLSSGEGKKTVFVRVRDRAGNEAPVVSARTTYEVPVQKDLLGQIAVRATVAVAIAIVILIVAARPNFKKGRQH